VSFPFDIYLAAIGSACLTTLVALPLWRKWCLAIGLVDDPGHRKIHEKPVPLAGGLAVMTSLLVPILIGCFLLWLGCGRAQPAEASSGTWPGYDPAYLLSYGLNRRALELAGIFIGGLGILLVGWLDDKHELRPGLKFAGQFLVALAVTATGTRITLFVHSGLFQYGVTILWLLTVINAFNFMDNMNGLCAGLGAIGAWSFGVIAAAQGHYLVALIAFLTFGALLGFLPYNFPKARAFLGDSGSHLVGYLLAVLAILPHFYTPHHQHRWAVVLPLLVLFIPLADMAWVVVLRWQKGQPFYVGDTNHLSHRLVRRGLTPTRAVLVIWLLASVLGALACLS